MLPSTSKNWFQYLKALFSTKKEPSPDAPNLYAFLVGINDYQHPVRALRGCVRDMNKVKKYLQKEEEKGDFKVHIETLINENAIKSNIAATFTAHLSQAGPNDVAFFFYAGHGAEEEADPKLWPLEPNNKLQGLVCIDSITEDETGTLLSDKELRYLIHKVGKEYPDGSPKDRPPHILTIFDCCHSGENTRNIGIGEEEEDLQERRFIPMKPKDPAKPRLAKIMKERAWKDFIFADQDGITTQAIQTSPLNKLLPEGDHIQLSACRSDESSYEQSGGGIFTKNLLEVLNRSKGAVSYYDLRGRLKNYIKNQFRQTPQIYEVGDNQLIYRSFLNKKEVGKPLLGQITHNFSDGWTMDMGAVHGMSKQARKVQVTSEGEEEVFEATIGRIEPSRTHLHFDKKDLRRLNKKKTYQGSIEGFMSAPIQVFINNMDQDEAAETQLKNLIEKEGRNLFFTPEEKGADYTVQLAFGRYHITLPEDPFRPLILPTKDYSMDAAEITFNNLNHISQWEYVKRLENDSQHQLPREDIKVEVFRIVTDENQNQSLKLIPFQKENELVEHLKEAPNGKLSSTLRFKITNLSEHRLWVSLVYLYQNFEVDAKWLTNKVQMLEPRGENEKEGGAAWAFEGDPDISFTLEEITQIFNWKEDVSYFKIIASRHEFTVEQLEQGGLPDPSELINRMRGEGEDKPPVQERDTENADAEAWMTELYTVRLPNPYYNKVSEKKLDTLLKTDAAEFIYHLYLDADQPFGGEAKLKEGIEWIPGTERGLFFDLKLGAANWLSRQIRHYKYRKIKKAHPDWVRIVSEGDSWFQHPHPKVRDIIDQLFEDHAIFSLGAGGDTLEKYFAKAEYKAAIIKEQPQFFLMSGGGNDILGKNIMDFLADDISDWDNAEELLNESFFKKVEKLGELYREVFQEIKDSFPKLKILCHGYDYIYPDPEKGWYGRYAGKRIKETAHLKLLADFLIDHFNAKLSAVASEFAHVHYLDLRGLNRDKNLWYDEIHPNSDGFKDVAEKFRLKIKEESQ